MSVLRTSGTVHRRKGIDFGQTKKAPAACIRFPFRNLEPTFFAGLLDDPLLLVRVRPAGSNLLFDCGQLHHLAKRVLTALDALFISHTHMDHWMGIDSVIRHLHASPRTINLFGPPGLADKLQHKLSGYDWNLAEEHWASFSVHEIYPDRIDRWLFSGPKSFQRRSLSGQNRNDRVIYQTPHLQVSAETCEHRVPSLIYRVDEKPTFLVDSEKLEQLELVPGPWLGKLKRRFFRGAEGQADFKVLKRQGEEVYELGVADPEELTRQLQRPQQQASLGYISDIGFTLQNRNRICELMRGVDLLLCECTYLRAAKDKARTSFHLCSDDINQLLAELEPTYFLPMHLSKTYSRRTRELYQELDPPAGTTILQIPPQLTPRPLQIREIDWQSLNTP
jgi:ribonuclease Z